MLMPITQWLKIIFLVLSMHLARLKYWYAAFFLILVLALSIFSYVFLLPPAGFHPNTTLAVAPGTSVRHEAALLKEAHVIRSTFVFRALYRLMPSTHGVQSGVYDFTYPIGELRLAWDLAHGISEVPEARITFPEGTTVRHMGMQLANTLPGVNEREFRQLALPEEGYLFPDTYFFRSDATTTEVIAILRSNFEDHFAGHAEQFAAFGKPEREVIIMASILEGEGKTLEDKRIIAGILWHRIALGMPLQVDAPFGYVHGAAGYTPTAADLASDSPYNTYRTKGLPPTPINNPGDVSIQAAITPTKSAYLYYLTGTDGTMHYAKTFSEHIANQKKYLK
ncbi:MAG: aminodeoxychorismate lyase, protein [Parcubacteria group bacterium]|nr:aminodeoxychorismate lyase, protein [Parcubacteria group bacterium]